MRLIEGREPVGGCGEAALNPAFGTPAPTGLPTSNRH